MQTKYESRIELEDLSQVKKKLNITVPANLVDQEVKAAYQSLKSSVSIAGFRKGAIPMNILRARFSAHVQEDVTKKLIETSYPQALQEKDLIPVERPQIEIKSDKLEEGKEFSYAVTVEVNPKLEITGYKEMELKKEKVEVSEQDIEQGLKNLLEGRAQFKDVERPAKEGDLVIVDFEARLDGNPIKGSKTADYPIVIGEKTLLPGFDDALKGASKGETKDANITFPEVYSEKNLAGKTAVFTITLKTVKEKSLPKLDEEFAKDMECDSLETLRKKVKDEIARIKEHNEKERLKTVILDKLIEKYPFEVPEALVNRYMALNLNRVVENMKQGIFAPGDQGLNQDQLRSKYRQMAIRQVKEDIVLDSIAGAEKVEVTEAETETAVKHLAAARSVSFESLMSRIEREGALEVIKDGLKHEKVFEIILNSSKTAA